MRDLLNKSLDDLFMKLDIQLFAYSDTHYTYWYDLGTAQYRFYFTLTETVNIPANTSSLAVKGYIQIDIGSEGSISFSTLSFASSINGSYTNSSQKSKTFTSSSSYLIGTITHTITHNADGTKSVSWKGRGRPYYSSTSWDAYTGTQTVNLETIPRYATISTYSLGSQTLSSFVTTWGTDVACDQVQYSLNSGAWVTATGSGVSGTFTVSGLSPETNYAVKIRVRRTDSQLYTESAVSYIVTLQQGKLTASANWNDEGNPVISFTNTNSQDLVFKIGTTTSTSLITRSVGVVASGNYTFELTTEERDILRALITTNANALTTRFTVATKVGSTETYFSYADKVMSLINYAPTFTDFAFEDTNANSLIMTGNASTLINGISNVKTIVSTANKMVANKLATPVKYRTNLGTKSEEVAYSSSSNVDMTINSIDAGIIYLSAIDSRGNLTQVVKTATIKAHETPVITDLRFERQNGISSTVNVIGSGTYTNENYGAHTNTIVKIEYSTDNTNWTDITSKFDISAGIFANKSSGNTLTGFTVGAEYVLYFKVSDGYSTYLLSTALSGATLSSGEPILDLNKTQKAMGIGCIAETPNQLDCGYDANFLGQILQNGNPLEIDPLLAYPVGTVYMNASSNTSPATLFGGTWVALTDRFLIGTSGTYTNGSTGGATTVTLDVTMIPSHTHTQDSHYHSGLYWSGGKPITLSTLNGNTSGYYTGYTSGTVLASNVYTGGATATNQNTGGGGSHANMPPYRAVYMWYRSA